MGRINRAIRVLGSMATFFALVVGPVPSYAQSTCIPTTTAPGSLDTCFGSSGSVTLDVTGIDEFQTASRIAVLPDGGFIVAGYARIGGAAGSSLFIARHTADGDLDTAFGTSGIVRTNVTASTADSEQFSGLAVQSDGELVVAAQVPAAAKGSAPYAFTVLRYHANGALDPTFGTAGVAQFAFEKNASAWVRDVTLTPDGRIVVAGSTSAGNSSTAAIARLTTTGALDATFDGDGKLVVSFGKNVTSSIASMALDAAGRVVAGGTVGASDAFLLRLTTSGALDTSFGAGGKVRTDLAGFANYFNGITIDPSGRILGVGRADLATSANASTELWVARYTSSGALDASFGTGGTALFDVNGTIDIANALAVQTDGRIVVVGDAQMNDYSFSHGAVIRQNTNGSLDDGTPSDTSVGDSFGTNGMTLIDFLAPTDYVRGVALQADDDGAKIIVLSVLDGSRQIALTRYFQ